MSDAINAIPDVYSADRDSLERVFQTYKEKESSLFETTVRSLEALKAKAKRNVRLTPDQKRTAESQVDAAVRWLKSGGTLDQHDVTLKTLLDASKKLRIFQKPLQRSMLSTCRTLERKGLPAIATQLTEASMKLGGTLNAQNAITPEMVFNGKRQQRKPGVAMAKTLRFTLRSDPVKGEGDKVETDMEYGGHSHHVLTWETDGLIFRARTGDPIREGHRLDQSINYDGVLVGNAIFGTFSGLSLQRKPVSGTFHVALKPPGK